MDRLSPLTLTRSRGLRRLQRWAREVSGLSLCLLASTLSGCDESAAAPPSRVVAVAAKPKATLNLANLCDVQPAQDAPVRFAFPELQDPTAAESAGLRWVNVWASWCKPCIEELPHIAQTLQALRKAGKPVQFVPISADAEADAVTTFSERFPLLAGSPRFADATQVAAWATQMGLDEGATLPLHLFVDSAGHVRCARAGAISEADMSLVGELLDEL